MATLLRVDGSTEPVNEPVVDLDAMRKRIGGYVELISLSDGRAMLVDEDGTLKSLPLNQEASHLYGRRIVGDVVLLTKAEHLRLVRE